MSENTNSPDPPLSDLIKGYGDRLKAAREALGYKQNEFARLLGISPDRYNHWEKGRHPPSPEHLALLKQKFGIGADWVLAGDYTSLSGKITRRLAQSEAERTTTRALPALPKGAVSRIFKKLLHDPAFQLHLATLITEVVENESGTTAIGGREGGDQQT